MSAQGNQAYHKGPATPSCLLVKLWELVHPTADDDHAVCASIIVGVCMVEDKAGSYLRQHDSTNSLHVRSNRHILCYVWQLHLVPDLVQK